MLHLLVSGNNPEAPPPSPQPGNCSSPLSFTAWGSLLGLGPSSSCSLGPGLRSVSIGSSLKLGDSRAVSRGKGSSKSTSVPRLWFVTWEPTHITHHHNRAREEGRLVQNSEGKPSTENDRRSLWVQQERSMLSTSRFSGPVSAGEHRSGRGPLPGHTFPTQLSDTPDSLRPPPPAPTVSTGCHSSLQGQLNLTAPGDQCPRSLSAECESVSQSTLNPTELRRGDQATEPSLTTANSHEALLASSGVKTTRYSPRNPQNNPRKMFCHSHFATWQIRSLKRLSNLPKVAKLLQTRVRI